MTGKMLKGPLIVKTDSGPGRLSSEAESIDFREEMANLGVYILLSLPNGIECQAELDQMFSDFQPRCKRSAIRIVGMKMKSRLDALRRAETATTPITVDSSSDSDESSDEDEDDDRSVAVAAPVEAPQAQSITKVKLCNLDLGHVINGFPGIPRNFVLLTFVSRRKRSSRPGSTLASCRIQEMRRWTQKSVMSWAKVEPPKRLKSGWNIWSRITPRAETS